MTPAERDDIAAAFAEDRARQLRSRAEYRRFPIAGRFDSARQTPCLECAAPTYSLAGLCAACRKETP